MQFRDLVLRLSAGNRKYSVGHVRGTRIDNTYTTYAYLHYIVLSFHSPFPNNSLRSFKTDVTVFERFQTRLCKRGETRYTCLQTKWHNCAVYRYPRDTSYAKDQFSKEIATLSAIYRGLVTLYGKTFAVVRDTARDITSSCFTIAIPDTRALLATVER